jgi:hypothetical protein
MQMTFALNRLAAINIALVSNTQACEYYDSLLLIE